MENYSVNDLAMDKQVYVFELDDVLFPRKDYILQVYYLFANFYEFTEGTVKSADMVQLMKKVYDIHGEDQVFPTLQALYGVQDKYVENFERLKANAQLPLRLELFQDVLIKLEELFSKGKNVAILTKGNPVEQLNKLKFLKWDSVEKYKDDIKIYFLDELHFRNINPVEFLAEEFHVAEEQICLVC